MPLSEDEQRILTEIELQLRASDPGLVREVGETTVYSAPLRRTRFAILGLILGMVVTVVLLFQVNAYAAFVVGFGLMFASAFALERNIRHLGRVGLGQLASTVRSSGVRDLFGLASDEDSDRSENDEA